MLSERAKNAIAYAARCSVETLGIEQCVLAGPTVLIDESMQPPVHPALQEEIRNNRDEAIRIVGGVFGMM